MNGIIEKGDKLKSAMPIVDQKPGWRTPSPLCF